MTAEEELIELRERHRFLEEHVKRIPVLEELLKQISEQVKTFQERLAKNSQKSSLPPSSDRFPRQSKARSVWSKSGKKPGGQSGHAGHCVQMSPTLDDVIALPPVAQCQHCQAEVSDVMATSTERRQVIDVPPPPALHVRQDEGEWKQCPHCQGDMRTAFPQGVSARCRTDRVLPRWRSL